MLATLSSCFCFLNDIDVVYSKHTSIYTVYYTGRGVGKKGSIGAVSGKFEEVIPMYEY
jgi:hypothetical protein